MKNLIIIFLIGIATIFFSCSDTSNLVSNPNDQIPTSVEKKVYSYFSGASVNIGVIDPGKTTPLPGGTVHIRGLVVQTEDNLNDARVNGIVTWIVNLEIYPDGSDKRWGSGELLIPELGKWDMNYKGWFIPGEGLTYEVDGHGKGEFKGLKAHWTYFLDSPPGVFEVQGYIEE